MRKSTRRQKRLAKAKRPSFVLLWKILIPFLVIAGMLLFIRLNTKYWNGKEKMAVAFQRDEGSVEVRVFDPKLSEVVSLVIPGDTEVQVSRNLGVLRLKNVWQLGINEGVEGKLLTETITKNFLFPVFLWRGAEGKTNLPLGDRLFLWFFERRVKNLERTEVNLGKSQFVVKTKLNDGEVGYKLAGDISERLTIYFSDDDISSGNVKVYINDATGAPGVAEGVGKIVEVMGGKVVTIEKGQAEDSDCVVIGALARKVARVFSCEVGKGKTNFDLEILLGRKFAKRY